MVDLLDEQLLRLLQRDPRQSSETLAAQLHVSSSTVRRRIKKLLKAGALRTVVATGPATSGFPLIAVICINIRPDRIEEAMNILRNRMEVRWVSTTTGRFDVIALARFSSTTDLSRFIQRQIAKLEGLRATESFICLDIMTSESALGY